MYIVNYKGELVFFDTEKYISEYDMYINLWKIMYNIEFQKRDTLTYIKNYLNDI